MQQLVYNLFYKQYGIRRLQHMLSPRLFPLELLHFPKGTVFHHVSYEMDDPNPDPNQLYFQGYAGRRIMTDLVTQIDEPAGNAKRNSIQPNVITRPFFLKNRAFKFMRDALDMIKDPNTLTVLNYAVLNKLYRYPTFALTPYYMWRNVTDTMWKKIAEISETSERNSFVVMNLPEVLPSFVTLRMYEERPATVAYLKIFDSPEKRFILELWKWINPELRNSSVIKSMTQAQLDHVNIVFVSNGKWCVLNLGLLNQWIKPTKELTEDEKANQSAAMLQVNHVQMQKLLLKLFITIKSQTIVPEKDIEQEEQGNAEQQSRGLDDDSALPSNITGELTQKPEVEISRKQPDILPHAAEPIVSDNSQAVGADILEDLDKDLQVLEHIENQAFITRGISRNEDTEEVQAEPAQKPAVSFEATPEELAAIEDKVFKEKSTQDVVRQYVDEHAEYGVISAADYRNVLKRIDAYMSSGSPYDSQQLISDYIQVKPEQLQIQEAEKAIPDIATVPDKTMLQSSLLSFDSKYIKTVMPKDIVAMVTNTQRAGLVIQEYNIETDASVLGEYEVHTLKIKPIDGAASTLRFRLPKVEEDGSFLANGNKYHMRKQRGDLPIRKINPSTVALTSYYGKAFVKRSDKKVNDTLDWLAKQLLLLGQSGESEHIKRVAPANVFDNNFVAPRIYSGLAHHFKSVDIGNYHLSFDYKEREKWFTSQEGKGLSASGQLNILENDNGDDLKYRVIGHDTNGNFVLVDFKDQFFLKEGGELKPLGDIYALSLIDQTKAPVDFAEVKIFAKTIPVGIVMSYMVGFTNLIKLLKIQPRVLEPRQRAELKADEWVIAFKDKKYVFSRKDRLASLVFGGFNEYWRSIKNYFVESFDQPNVYLNVLESNGIGARYLRELSLLDKLFVDPITRDILIEMKEPVTFQGLVMRGCEMLLHDLHLDSQDMRGMRIKGYERFAGAIYKEMVMAIRDFKARNIRGKSQMELNPYCVWRNITQDPAVEIVKDINPLENLKQTESVTYVGEGGRKKEAMVKKDRIYHQSDVGIVSEATVDSSDVGVNAFLTANPLFTSLRGMADSFAYENRGAACMVSTSAIISPGADKDDIKRLNFISIQQSHTIACVGYRQPAVRTGYEQVLAHRSGDMFAVTAKEPGKVISVNEQGIIVEYESGDRKGVHLGRQYGKAEGTTYPHDITTMLKAGDTFVPGDCIAYNTGFFEPDFMNPKQVVWRSSMNVKTVLCEATQTYDDSSAISRKVSQAMTTQVTKMRSFVVDFKQGVKNVRKPGSEVQPTDVLLIIEDEITTDTGLFDEQTIATLQKLSNKAPRAKVRGIIDRMEVFYHGNKEDMSASLRNLANFTDKEMAERAKAVGKPVYTGKVNDEYRVAGTPLAVDSAEIKIYLTISDGAGVGDKGVFGNQMKSVFTEVMDYPIKTESGDPVDAIFGWKSISNRQVHSPVILGTTNTILKLIGRKAIELYRGK